MNLFEKLNTAIIFLAVALGISAGKINAVQANSESFIAPLLVLILYITFLQIPIAQAKQAFHITKFSSVSLLMNFVWTPLLAWFLASFFWGISLPCKSVLSC